MLNRTSHVIIFPNAFAYACPMSGFDMSICIYVQLNEIYMVLISTYYANIISVNGIFALKSDSIPFVEQNKCDLFSSAMNLMKHCSMNR